MLGSTWEGKICRPNICKWSTEQLMTLIWFPRLCDLQSGTMLHSWKTSTSSWGHWPTVIRRSSRVISLTSKNWRVVSWPQLMRKKSITVSSIGRPVFFPLNHTILLFCSFFLWRFQALDLSDHLYIMFLGFSYAWTSLLLDSYVVIFFLTSGQHEAETWDPNSNPGGGIFRP